MAWGVAPYGTSVCLQCNMQQTCSVRQRCGFTATCTHMQSSNCPPLVWAFSDPVVNLLQDCFINFQIQLPAASRGIHNLHSSISRGDHNSMTLSVTDLVSITLSTHLLGSEPPHPCNNPHLVRVQAQNHGVKLCCLPSGIVPPRQKNEVLAGAQHGHAAHWCCVTPGPPAATEGNKPSLSEVRSCL